MTTCKIRKETAEEGKVLQGEAYRWRCTTHKITSAWFSTTERRDAAARKHETNRAVSS
jgi:hypothetical protein